MPIPKILSNKNLELRKNTHPSDHRPQTSNGFTLIELLLVVAILGILATIIAYTIPIYLKRARDAQRKTDIDNIAVALQNYYSNKGHYPTQNIAGILGGYVFGCEDPVKIINAGTPWVCEDDEEGKFTEYMKIYSKDPNPLYLNTDGSKITFTGFVGYIYQPMTQNYQDICFGSYDCEAFQISACLEDISNVEESTIGVPIGYSGGLAPLVLCPPDRAAYTITNN